MNLPVDKLGQVRTVLVVLDLNVPTPPKKPEQMEEWLELFRTQVEVNRLEVELARAACDLEVTETERLRALSDRAQLEHSAEEAAIRLATSRLELAQLRRSEREAESSASQSRVYAFYQEVDDRSVAEAVVTLDAWSRNYPGQPIEIQLTSPGGTVLDGLALYDFIRSLSSRGHQVTVTVFGFAASMGAVLLQAGDIRKMGANSFIMIHEVASGTYGKVSELEDHLDFGRRLQERLIRLLCAQSELTVVKVREMWRRRDVWIDARGARKLKLVDVIIA